jgi:hypothetical protein
MELLIDAVILGEKPFAKIREVRIYILRHGA